LISIRAKGASGWLAPWTTESAVGAERGMIEQAPIEKGRLKTKKSRIFRKCLQDKSIKMADLTLLTLDRIEFV
jgi:hypothetical protein